MNARGAREREGPFGAQGDPSCPPRRPKATLPEPRVLGQALDPGPGVVVPRLQLHRDFQGQAHRLLVLVVTQAYDRRGRESQAHRHKRKTQRGTPGRWPREGEQGWREALRSEGGL